MKQQKCLGHLFVAGHIPGGRIQDGTGAVVRFQVQGLLREGIQIGKSAPAQERQPAVQDLEDRPTWHLRDRILRDDDNQRLLNGIGRQMDRGLDLTFLHEPGVEPTNNRAERMLRPAVIARKVSHCSKTNGALTPRRFY